MFGRYLHGEQAQAIMLPSSFVATPTSSWYMASGIHLLQNSGDPVAEALASAREAHINDTPTSDGPDASSAEVFAGISSFDFQLDQDPASAPRGDERVGGQSKLIAELVSAVTSDEPNDKVHEWMNADVDSSESMPEWASSEDEWSENEDREGKEERRKDSMRKIQMSPSNLRPMTANYEACEPQKLEVSEGVTVEEGTGGEAGEQPREATAEELAAMIREEERLAEKIEFMCSISGERPVDVQAMYVHKMQLCPLVTPHDWIKCSYAHQGEVARRRDPATHSANPCSEYERNQTCSRGERCRFSHGVWERGLHPQRYRTSLCSKGENCDRRICFFAHMPEQLRKSSNGKGTNNEHIASVSLVPLSEKKMSRRRTRALARTDGTMPLNKTIEQHPLPPLPPSHKKTSEGQQSKSGKITVEVETKLTSESKVVEGGAGTECVSPGSCGTGELSNTSYASSQASTVQTVPWAEDNFAERGVVEELRSNAAHTHAHTITHAASRAGPAGVPPTVVENNVRKSPHALSLNSPRSPSALRNRSVTPAGGVGAQKPVKGSEWPAVEEGNGSVGVDHFTSITSSKDVDTLTPKRDASMADEKGGANDSAKTQSAREHNLGWAMWATSGMWSVPESKGLPAPDSGPVSLGLLQRGTGARKIHTSKASSSSSKPHPAAPSDDGEVSYESKLIGNVLALSNAGEGNKSEWLIEPNTPASILSGGGGAAVTFEDALRMRSVFGDTVGPKSEWLKDSLEHVEERPHAQYAHAPRDSRAANSRSVSPCKLSRGVEGRCKSPGGELRRGVSPFRRGGSPGPDTMLFDTDWVGRLVDAPDGAAEREEEDSIQKWGEWVLNTATSTLAHASPGRYAGDAARHTSKLSKASSGAAQGKSVSGSTSWLLTEAATQSNSDWLLAGSSGSESAKGANNFNGVAAHSGSGWLLDSAEEKTKSKRSPNTASGSRGAGNASSRGAANAGFSSVSASAFSAVSGKSITSFGNSLFGSPAAGSNSWLLTQDEDWSPTASGSGGGGGGGRLLQQYSASRSSRATQSLTGKLDAAKG